ncbi:MAG: hypothetical protein J6Y82_05030 [Bacteroidales bacterium]|nr:hypothetical protein [Bacteroidales bacterium]
MIRISLVMLLSVLLVACKQQAELNNTLSVSSPVNALRPVVIYKTKGDYYYNVPITLSDDKQMIVSFPAPTDVKAGDVYLLPTKLAKGYLLDNRGIGINSVFTKYTYKEYSALTALLSLGELKQSIVDYEPIAELWISSSPSSISVDEINSLINSKSLSKRFKRLK